MNSKLKYLPNSITVLRIIGSVALLFAKPLSLIFFIIYLIAGISDILDGFISRKFNLTSKLGAKLDSIADLIFYASMLIKILPILWVKLHKLIWVFVAIVIIIRLLAYIVSAIKFRCFASSHSILNKITGFVVFSAPFALLLSFYEPICWFICFMCFISSLIELIKYIFSNSNTKINNQA